MHWDSTYFGTFRVDDSCEGADAFVVPGIAVEEGKVVSHNNEVAWRNPAAHIDAVLGGIMKSLKQDDAGCIFIGCDNVGAGLRVCPGARGKLCQDGGCWSMGEAHSKLGVGLWSKSGLHYYQLQYAKMNYKVVSVYVYAVLGQLTLNYLSPASFFCSDHHVDDITGEQGSMLTANVRTALGIFTHCRWAKSIWFQAVWNGDREFRHRRHSLCRTKEQLC